MNFLLIQSSIPTQDHRFGTNHFCYQVFDIINKSLSNVRISLAGILNRHLSAPPPFIVARVELRITQKNSSLPRITRITEYFLKLVAENCLSSLEISNGQYDYREIVNI